MKSPVYTTMCYSSGTGKREDKGKVSLKILKMPGTSGSAAQAWHLHQHLGKWTFFDVVNFCTFPYKRCI